MRFIDKNTFIEVKEASLQEIYTLDTILRVKDDAPWYSKAYKKGLWDGYHKLFSKRYKKFPAGLWYVIEKTIKNAHLETNKPKIKITTNLDILSKDFQHPELYSHQKKAFNACIRHSRGIVEIPTAGGKSALISLLAKAYKTKILVLVDKKALMTQTVENLQNDLHENIGIIGAGTYNPQRITVAITRSAEKYIDELSDIGCLIVDECHISQAKGVNALLLSIPAYYRFGLSADPLDKYRLKKNSRLAIMQIQGCFGPIIYKESVANLKKKNIISKPKIVILKVESDSNSETSYQKAYCEAYCNNSHLNDALFDLCEDNSTKQILILFKHIHHGKSLELLLKKFNGVMLSGEEPLSKINQAKQAFKDGKLKLIIASTIFNHGIDIPNIEILINAAGDMAPTKQRLGRAMRKKEYSDSVLIYDFLITGNDYMERHTNKRVSIYLSEGHNVITKRKLIENKPKENQK